MSWGVSGLTVRFGGEVALEDIEMTIEAGSIHAVIGGDGAGKSTLLRVLAGLGIGHEGDVRLPAAGRIGFVPSSGGLYRDLTVDENVEFIADAYRLRSWRPRADELLARADLGAFGQRLAGHLSGGQQRKLAGSMAMLAQPDLLVLDEVTTGVDPVSRMDLWRLVASAAASGTAVVAATTYLDEAERATSVLLLHRGRVLASGPPESIVARVPGTVAAMATPEDAATAWRRGRIWRQWDPDGRRNDDHRTTLEDASIVFELMADGVRR